MERGGRKRKGKTMRNVKNALQVIFFYLILLTVLDVAADTFEWVTGINFWKACVFGVVFFSLAYVLYDENSTAIQSLQHNLAVLQKWFLQLLSQSKVVWKPKGKATADAIVADATIREELDG